jgi:hypothetical protein
MARALVILLALTVSSAARTDLGPQGVAWLAR